MSMSLSFGVYQQLQLTQQVALPPTNWSLLDAFKREGQQPLCFAKIQLDCAGKSLESRLAVVDAANEVFRFAYSQGVDGKYYKIPLLRNQYVEIDDIALPITRKEYDRATAILEGAGHFQRIARAVPYAQLHADVKSFVEKQGYQLDDVVVIGVDRGGRLPSFIMREALGKVEGYTLKVDQASGSNGALDQEKLDLLIQQGVLQNKFLLFVDSTVDSGRQIEVLRRYFDDLGMMERVGYKGWAVVGSNESGESLYKHCNINWGLDPDQSFEDNPELMGVDYDAYSRVKTIECPSPSSEKIKKALLEVPQGVVLDLSNVNSILAGKKFYQTIEKRLKSPTWDKLLVADVLPRRVLAVDSIVPLVQKDVLRQKLLVIGDGRKVSISWDAAETFAQAVVPQYDLFAGTPAGNPGLVLMSAVRSREGSAQLYQRLPDPEEHRELSLEMFGKPVIFRGESKEFFRQLLVQNADKVVVLGGGSGTLAEMLLACHEGKSVYVLDQYGPVSKYIHRIKKLRNTPQINVVATLQELVAVLAR